MSQLLTVLVSVVLAGITAYIVARIESRDRKDALAWERQQFGETAQREHGMWLRERRFESYTELLVALEEARMSVIPGSGSGSAEQIEKFKAAQSAGTRAQAVASLKTLNYIRTFLTDTLIPGVYPDAGANPRQAFANGALRLMEQMRSELTAEHPSYPLAQKPTEAPGQPERIEPGESASSKD